MPKMHYTNIQHFEQYHHKNNCPISIDFRPESDGVAKSIAVAFSKGYGIDNSGMLLYIILFPGIIMLTKPCHCNNNFTFWGCLTIII
jgi:hypothetical protein